MPVRHRESDEGERSAMGQIGKTSFAFSTICRQAGNREDWRVIERGKTNGS